MVSMALCAIMLLDNCAALFLLVACIDFHTPAGPVNAVFTHVAVHQRSAAGDMVQGVAARFLVTDPTQVAEASMSSMLTTRLVLQIKHVNNKVRISPPSPPPFLLLAVHEQSVLPIKHVNDEVIISVHEQSMPLIKHVGDEVIISQIKHINSEVIVPAFGFPLPLLPTLQRSAAQIKHIDDKIKHVDDKGSINSGIMKSKFNSNLLPRTFGDNLPNPAWVYDHHVIPAKSFHTMALNSLEQQNHILASPPPSCSHMCAKRSAAQIGTVGTVVLTLEP
ncbi:hypothetical protein BKA83DRAFT_4128754 [Pisolithus microcarpus]|nr:hypothetical protein BKA83DRAFT_4128754 [Pisolithus microcarpus]